MLVTVLPWGVLADRVGERAVMATGLSVATVSLAAAANADGFAVLVIALMGQARSARVFRRPVAAP